MSRIHLVILFCFVFTGSLAQDNVAIGVFGGTSQYLGDLNKTNPVYKASPSYGFTIKANRGLRHTFSFRFSYNTLRGNYGDFDDFIYPSNYIDTVKSSFDARVADFSVNAEFNFLPYETYNIRKRNFTPYIFAGLGTNYFTSGEENQFPLIIPFGLGIKYNIFERFSIGMEWTAKKTFFDGMDGIENVSLSGNGSVIHNDDWYHHAVLFITYNPFRKKIDCPAYGNNN